MLNKIRTVGFSLLFICFSGAGMAQSAKEFSDQVEKHTDSLYLLAARWSSSFQDQYNGKQNYKELGDIRSEMEEFLVAMIKEYKENSDVSGSKKLNDAMVAFFEFEQKLVKEGFIPFEKLGSSATEEQINACKQKLKEKAIPERDYAGKVSKERRDYAAANNFSLDPVDAPQRGKGMRYPRKSPPGSPSPNVNQKFEPQEPQRPSAPAQQSAQPQRTIPQAKQSKPPTENKEDTDDEE